MKKKSSIMLSFVMLLSMSVTAFAAEAPKAEEFANKYVVDGIAPVTQIDGSIYDNVLSLTIDIDDLIARSTNVTRSGSSYSGSYESDKYDAGLPGYKYQISFDWKADVNSAGNYVFKDNSIQNPLITTHTNHFILAMTWSYYNYSFTKNTYGVATNGRSVTFETDYKFTVYEKDTAFDHTFTQENTKTIYIDDLL